MDNFGKNQLLLHLPSTYQLKLQVDAALTYYHANKDEIETYLAEEEELYQRLAKESQAGKL